MAQLVVFLLVLALVYVAKAVVIARTHEELVADDAAFSWMRPATYGETLALAETLKQEPEPAKAPAPAAPASASGRMLGFSA